MRSPEAKRTVVYLPNELWIYLFELADKQNVTMTRLITTLVLKALGDEAPPCPSYLDYLKRNPSIKPTQEWAKLLHKKQLELIKNLLIQQKTLSRKELARQTKLNVNTITKLINNLRAFYPDNVHVERRENEMYVKWVQ